MPYATISGKPLYYRLSQNDVAGRRPPLILVHGAGGTHMHWPAAWRRLPEWDVYALDLPGHGKSPGPGFDTIAGYRDVVYRLCQVLGLEQVVLAGHSMGSAIVQEFALHYSQRLAGMVLVGAGAKLRVAPAILEGLRSDFANACRMIADWAHDRDASEQVKRIYVQQLLQNDPQVMLGDYLACDRFDLRADLERIPTPALVICGMEDVMTPPRYGEYLAEHLPDATLVQVERAGHMVMFEAPDETAAAVSRFLSGLQPAG